MCAFVVVCRRLGDSFFAGYSRRMSKSEPHLGARVTADLFKGFAVVSFVSGVVAMVVSDRTYVSGTATALVVVEGAELVATLFCTAAFAFFAYVLDLLVEISEA